jgi:hypothetical protein
MYSDEALLPFPDEPLRIPPDRGVLLNIASLFCTKAYIHDHSRRHRARSAVYQFQWA